MKQAASFVWLLIGVTVIVLGVVSGISKSGDVRGANDELRARCIRAGGSPQDGGLFIWDGIKCYQTIEIK